MRYHGPEGRGRRHRLRRGRGGQQDPGDPAHEALGGMRWRIAGGQAVLTFRALIKSARLRPGMEGPSSRARDRHTGQRQNHEAVSASARRHERCRCYPAMTSSRRRPNGRAACNFSGPEGASVEAPRPLPRSSGSNQHALYYARRTSGTVLSHPTSGHRRRPTILTIADAFHGSRRPVSIAPEDHFRTIWRLRTSPNGIDPSAELVRASVLAVRPPGATICSAGWNSETIVLRLGKPVRSNGNLDPPGTRKAGMAPNMGDARSRRPNSCRIWRHRPAALSGTGNLPMEAPSRRY